MLLIIKKLNKNIFKNSGTLLMHSILDRNYNIHTNPTDIAIKIYIQQSINNRPIVFTCYYQPNQFQLYTCVIRQYPWYDIDGSSIEK